MSKGFNVGGGREILFTRGLMEWLVWLGRTENAESAGKIGTLQKHEMTESANDIVVLLANIIQNFCKL